MVRINIINPKYLSDQHLLAEYYEILMLFGYAKKYPEPKQIPEKYVLGKGHIKFFKNKLRYLEKRHEEIRAEMSKRGFSPKIKPELKGYKKELLNGWSPSRNDLKAIKERIIYKLKLKPDFYKYYGNKKCLKYLINMIKNAK